MNNFYPDYTGLFGDARLDSRAQALWRKLSLNPASSVRRLSEDRAEQKAYYRLLHNPKLMEEKLIEEASRRVKDLCSGKHVLCIQDTCEVNLGKHKGRLRPGSGLGRSDKADSAHCFKLHPGLVVNAEDFSPLGFSHVKVFHRPEDKPRRQERNYKKQPICEKESYKWIEVANRSKEALEQAASVTFVEDREGDIFEQFAQVADENHHLLVRSRTTRKLSSGKSLYEEVERAPVAGHYTIALPSDKRKDRYKRNAHVELRFARYELQRPGKLSAKDYPASVAVTCVSVREKGGGPQPIHWKLLTTHQVNSYQQALLLVEWYSARWYIEQVFRLLKKQGFGIEEAELESGWAIRKLVIMQMTAILKILQMNIAYADPEGGQPIEEVFTPAEVEVLRLMNKKLQGKTKKQQNLHDPKSTKWAAWIVGRLGGWKGYDSQGPPGVIILKRGLDRLSYILEGMNLAKDVGTP